MMTCTCTVHLTLRGAAKHYYACSRQVLITQRRNAGIYHTYEFTAELNDIIKEAV